MLNFLVDIFYANVQNLKTSLLSFLEKVLERDMKKQCFIIISPKKSFALGYEKTMLEKKT